MELFKAADRWLLSYILWLAHLLVFLWCPKKTLAKYNHENILLLIGWQIKIVNIIWCRYRLKYSISSMVNIINGQYHLVQVPSGPPEEHVRGGIGQTGRGFQCCRYSQVPLQISLTLEYSKILRNICKKFWWHCETAILILFALTALPTSTTRGPSSHLPWPWSAGTWRRWWGPGAGRSWFCRNRWTPPTSHYKKINEISCFWKHCHFYGFPIPV